MINSFLLYASEKTICLHKAVLFISTVQRKLEFLHDPIGNASLFCNHKNFIKIINEITISKCKEYVKTSSPAK